jgi:putative acetyltransferase
MDTLMDTYGSEGSNFFVALNAEDGVVIGGAGIGPLRGLPVSEGLGEVRDMVLEEDYRGKGIGTKLLNCCLEVARANKFRQIYLETTPQMENAVKLFKRFGFRPVTDNSMGSVEPDQDLPQYYLLENVTPVEDS